MIWTHFQFRSTRKLEYLIRTSIQGQSMHLDLPVSWCTLTCFSFATILFALIESTKFQDYEISSKLYGKYRKEHIDPEGKHFTWWNSNALEYIKQMTADTVSSWCSVDEIFVYWSMTKIMVQNQNIHASEWPGNSAWFDFWAIKWILSRFWNTLIFQNTYKLKHFFLIFEDVWSSIYCWWG